MGFGFAILLHLIGIFILSVVLAVLAVLITFFVSTKPKRKRKVVLAIVCPFIGLYTAYFVGLVGSVIVCEHKGVDIGIGDNWYVSLGNGASYGFIDLPEQNYIGYGDETVVSDITGIQQVGNRVFGRTVEGTFFLLDTKTRRINVFTKESELTSRIPKDITLRFGDTSTFYEEKREEVLGGWLIAVGVLAIAISVGVVCAFIRIFLAIVGKLRARNRGGLD